MGCFMADPITRAVISRKIVKINRQPPTAKVKFNPFRVGIRAKGFFPRVAHTVIHVQTLRVWASCHA